MTETKSPRPRAPELYGIPEEEIARICRVHVRTARRWKQGIREPPETALMILRRDLACFSASWERWTIRGEEIISPDGWAIRRNDALAVPLMHRQIDALRQELEATKKALEEVRDAPRADDQPTPDQWQIVLRA